MILLQSISKSYTPSNFIRFSPFIPRRFYRNFTNSSPTSKPGFIPFENVQKLIREQEESKKNTKISSLLPEGLNFISFHKDKPMINLKGNIHPHEIGNLRRFILFLFNSFLLDNFVNSYPNQSKPNILSLLNIRKPLSTLNISSLSQEAAFSLAESLQAQFDSETDAFVQCANVLKKRRRRMRGHKHKKRLKERRHKADK